MQETLKDWYYYPGTSVPKLNLFQKTVQALAGVAQWIECGPTNPKGHQFDSQSEHIPGLQAMSPIGGAQEATTH